MSYLQTLQQHNASLQSLIDTANALPEAGNGGGSTCILSYSDGGTSSANHSHIIWFDGVDLLWEIVSSSHIGGGVGGGYGSIEVETLTENYVYVITRTQYSYSCDNAEVIDCETLINNQVYLYIFYIYSGSDDVSIVGT